VSQKNAIIILAVIILAFGGYRLFSPAHSIKNSKPRGETIICFGDSLTAGTGATAGRDYPAQLAALIGRPVVNAGVPGNTTADALARLNNDVLNRSPRIVIITLGGNDLKNGLDRETAFRNLRVIVETIQQQGALVVVGGLKFFPLDRGYAAAYDQLAAETGALLVPDILGGIMGETRLMSDQIHPNDEGYARMAEKFHKALQPYL